MEKMQLNRSSSLPDDDSAFVKSNPTVDYDDSQKRRYVSKELHHTNHATHVDDVSSAGFNGATSTLQETNAIDKAEQVSI